MTARRACTVALSNFAAAVVARARPRDARALVVLAMPGTPGFGESLVGTFRDGMRSAGALFSHQADVRDSHRRAAGCFDRIVKGAAPGDPRVYQPDRCALVVTARVARELWVALPKSFVPRAERVFQ